MTGQDILVALGHVDDHLIDEAENKMLTKKQAPIKWMLPVAASFVIIIMLVFLRKTSNIPFVNPNPDANPPFLAEDEKKPENSGSYRLHFNNSDMISANKIAPQGYFWYDLSTEQANQILPILAPKYELTGTAHYSSVDEIATLYEVVTSIIVDEHITGTIVISPNEIVKDCILAGTPVVSTIEGIPVTAGLFITDKNSMGEQNYLYFADFKLDNVSYYMEFASLNKEAEDIFTSLVADVILGNKADLSLFDNPIIPTIIDKDLSEQEAYDEADFGKYLLAIPKEYSFNGASRLKNQTTNALTASWSNGYNDVSIQVMPHDDYSKMRMVSPEDTALYDMSLYPIPWVDSMPRDQAPIIENPVFRIEDLTLDMIQKRGFVRNESGEGSQGQSLNMRFCVLFEDIVVEISSEDLSAEYLFDQLTSLLEH